MRDNYLVVFHTENGDLYLDDTFDYYGNYGEVRAIPDTAPESYRKLFTNKKEATHYGSFYCRNCLCGVRSYEVIKFVPTDDYYYYKGQYYHK